MTLPFNGASTSQFLQSSVQAFFAAINWDDHTPEVQQLKVSPTASLSLTLSVSQFFGAIQWDSPTIAPPSPEAPSEPLEYPTLADFFNQF